MEEVWQTRFPDEDGSVHLRQFPRVPEDWRNDAIAALWASRRRFRRVVTGALEIQRKDKVIGSSLEAAPVCYVDDAGIRAALDGIALDEMSITSDLTLAEAGAEAPADAFRLDDVTGVSVVFAKASGQKCNRCWMILPEVGSQSDHPTLCIRCAGVVRNLDAQEKDDI